MLHDICCEKTKIRTVHNCVCHFDISVSDRLIDWQAKVINRTAAAHTELCRVSRGKNRYLFIQISDLNLLNATISASSGIQDYKLINYV